MVYSKDELFEVIFYNNRDHRQDENNRFKEVTTPQGVYIIGELGKEFVIMVRSHYPDVFAIKCIIDGYTLPFEKTFRRYGHLIGQDKIIILLQSFKEVGQNIKAFKFGNPSQVQSDVTFKKSLQVQENLDEQSQNDQTDYEGGPGEIIIKIYRTREIVRRQAGYNPRYLNAEQFQPFATNNDKKSIDQSLGIQFGEEIQPKYRYNYQGGISNKGIYDRNNLVVSFRIFYADIYALIDKGYVQADQHYHLRLLPDYYFKNNQGALIQTLQALLRHGNLGKPLNEQCLPIDTLYKRLRQYINFPLEHIIGIEHQNIPQIKILFAFLICNDKYFTQQDDEETFEIKTPFLQKYYKVMPFYLNINDKMQNENLKKEDKKINAPICILEDQEPIEIKEELEKKERVKFEQGCSDDEII